MSKEYCKQVGNRIFTSRKNLKLSRAELGKKLNLHETTIKRYEDGEIKLLDVEKISEFAKALDVSPLYLMGWDNEKNERYGINNNHIIENSSEELDKELNYNNIKDDDIDNNRIIKNLALFIKSKRQDCNLSIEELSEKTGISPTILQSYETVYLKNISLYNLLKLYKALDIQSSEILGFFDAIRISSTDDKNKLSKHELDLYNILKDVSPESLEILTRTLKTIINYSKHSKYDLNLKK